MCFCFALAFGLLCPPEFVTGHGEIDGEQDIPSALRDIIERCWAAQPEARPTMEQAVQVLKVAVADFSP
jgi:hypothetical protein